jgi:hypothetical protein
MSMIYRFSIFITGDSYSPISDIELQDFPVYSYSAWKRNDAYHRNGQSFLYEYGGSQLLHNSVFAISEKERSQMVEDFVDFLDRAQPLLRAYGVEEIKISVVAYVSQNTHFVLFTKTEMDKLSRIDNIVVSLDVLCVEEEQLNSIYDELILERR